MLHSRLALKSLYSTTRQVILRPKMSVESTSTSLHDASVQDTVSSKRQKLDAEISQKKSVKPFKKKKRKVPPVQDGSGEDVLIREIRALLRDGNPQGSLEDIDSPPPFQTGEIVELEVQAISSTGIFIACSRQVLNSQRVGDSLSVVHKFGSPWVVVTPFAMPKERIRVKIFRHGLQHSYGHLDEVLQSNNEMRDMARVKCKYFTKCGGCQYQVC